MKRLLMKRLFDVAKFASVVWALAGSSALADGWGDLAGTFTYGGSAPAASKVAVTKDVEVCGKFNLVDESLVVNSNNKGLANVVVFMYYKRDVPPIHESYQETAEAKVAFDNLNCEFSPRIATMRTSQVLEIGNKDPIGHNTKVDALSNSAINPIVPANSSMDQKFPKAERLPVGVSCSIHPWMKGFLVVREDPYFAVSDENGKFEIKNVPAGESTFLFWHEKPGYIDEVVMDGKKTKLKKGRIEVEIADGQTEDLGAIEVPASMFK